MEPEDDRLLAQGVSARMTRAVLLNGIFRPIINYYVHPDVTGLENLDAVQPPFLLAPNHSSHMDTPLVLMSLPAHLRRRTLVAAASDYFFAKRWLGTFVSVAVGAVPMERRSANRQSMSRVTRLLSEGWCIMMYPEGSRTRDGQLYRGKTGIARLALEANVPVIPVGITGTYQAMPSGRSWPVPGVVQVRFGKPLTFERYTLGTTNQMVLRAIADQIMYEIMSLTGLTYVDEYCTSSRHRTSRGDGALQDGQADVAEAPIQRQDSDGAEAPIQPPDSADGVPDPDQSVKRQAAPPPP